MERLPRLSQPIVTVDAFTAVPFAGNPAAVCLLPAPRPDAWLQAVAREMNLSETAFLEARGPGRYGLRWFTPAAEVDLCGHATLASAWFLYHEAGERAPELVFETRSGELRARQGEQAGWIVLDFPSDRPRPLADAGWQEQLEQALGAPIVSLSRARHYHLAELADAAVVRDLSPDFGRLKALQSGQGVIVTAAADDDGERGQTCDFVSRMFTPALGIDEDPVTGSAHCVLAPYWAERLGRNGLRGFQVSARGGLVAVDLPGGVGGERVTLAGPALVTLRGTLVGESA